MTLGDRLMVLNDGVVEQFGTPIELYDKPETKFVAGFIGSPSIFKEGSLYSVTAQKFQNLRTITKNLQ